MPYTPYYPTVQPPYYSPPVPDQLTQLRQNQYQMPVPPQNQQPVNQQQSNSGIIWVQGEEGAKAYMVAAGNSVLLMDSENSAFYIKSTDASGMPMPLRIFDYTERTAQSKTPQESKQIQFATKDELNALEARVNALTTGKAKEEKKDVQSDI